MNSGSGHDSKSGEKTNGNNGVNQAINFTVKTNNVSLASNDGTDIFKTQSPTRLNFQANEQNPKNINSANKDITAATNLNGKKENLVPNSSNINTLNNLQTNINGKTKNETANQGIEQGSQKEKSKRGRKPKSEVVQITQNPEIKDNNLSNKNNMTPYDFLQSLENKVEDKGKKRSGRRKKGDGQDSDESFHVDEEEKLFRKPKESKQTASPKEPKERPLPKIDRSIEVKHIIDIEELNKKNKLSNSEMILAICEITTNSKYYGMQNSTRSRIFWEIIENMDDYENVFGSFRSETLRKYWRMLSAVENTGKIVKVVQENQKLIDNQLLK